MSFWNSPRETEDRRRVLASTAVDNICVLVRRVDGDRRYLLRAKRRRRAPLDPTSPFLARMFRSTSCSGVMHADRRGARTPLFEQSKSETARFERRVPARTAVKHGRPLESFGAVFVCPDAPLLRHIGYLSRVLVRRYVLFTRRFDVNFRTNKTRCLRAFHSLLRGSHSSRI